MSPACRTAAKLGPWCQPCFTVTDLLLLPYKCATIAFCTSEAPHRKVCCLTCCARKDCCLNTDLRFALASELVPIAGPNVTYGSCCSRRYLFSTVGSHVSALCNMTCAKCCFVSSPGLSTGYICHKNHAYTSEIMHLQKRHKHEHSWKS